MKTPYWEDVGSNKNYNFHLTNDIDVLTDLIKGTSNSLIEFATGTGLIINTLRKKGWNGEYFGTDYSDAFLKSAEENNPDEIFSEADLSQPLPFPKNAVEACVVHHGLEYVYPYKLALSEMKRIASKYVFITFWVPFLKGENQIRFNEQGKWNVNFYDEQEWFDTLTELGFEVLVDTEIPNEGNKYNRLFQLKV